MHLPTCLFLAFAGYAIAAGGAAAKWHALAERSGGMIKLNSRTFDEITAAPRNYSVAVTLTALHPNFKCQPCRLFDAEARLIAKSWVHSSKSNEHFFATLDFPDGQEIFKRLNLQTAPHTKLYLPTEGPRASPEREPATYDISRTGPSAEQYVQFLRANAKIPFPFRRPPNYAAMASTGVVIVLIALTSYQFWPYLRAVLFGRELWAILTNLFIVSMTGGYMWNQIRHPPYAMPGQDGKVSYIAGGYQSQYAVETQIIGAIYAVLSFAAYTLVVTVPWISDPWRQRVATYIWAGVFIFMASVLVTIFKTKQGGYPFGLLLG